MLVLFVSMWLTEQPTKINIIEIMPVVPSTTLEMFIYLLINWNLELSPWFEFLNEQEAKPFGRILILCVAVALQKLLATGREVMCRLLLAALANNALQIIQLSVTSSFWGQGMDWMYVKVETEWIKNI